MKNVIFIFLFAISCSLTAYAEPVSKALSTDVIDVECMPGDAVCDITLVNGQTLNIEFTALTSYLSVDKNAKFVFDNDTFRFNDKGEVVSLSPTKFGKSTGQSQQPVSQPVQQQASEPPYKLENQFADGSVAVKVVSMVSHLTVQNIVVNDGNCDNGLGVKRFPKTISTGQFTYVVVGQSCNIVKVDVVTDQGTWTHTIR